MAKPAEVQRLLAMPLATLEASIHDAYFGTKAPLSKAATAKIQPYKKLKGAALSTRTFLSDGLKKHRLLVHQTLCEKLKYCERVESQPVKVIVEIADAIVLHHLLSVHMFPVPVVELATYIVRVRILDPFCLCVERAQR